jgi:hypothetical protein
MGVMDVLVSDAKNGQGLCGVIAVAGMGGKSCSKDNSEILLELKYADVDVEYRDGNGPNTLVHTMAANYHCENLSART